MQSVRNDTKSTIVIRYPNFDRDMKPGDSLDLPDDIAARVREVNSD